MINSTYTHFKSRHSSLREHLTYQKNFAIEVLWLRRWLEENSTLEIDRTRDYVHVLPVDFEVAAATVGRTKRILPSLHTATARFVSFRVRWLCRRGVSTSKAFFRPMNSLLKRLLKSVISPKTTRRTTITTFAQQSLTLNCFFWVQCCDKLITIWLVTSKLFQSVYGLFFFRFIAF